LRKVECNEEVAWEERLPLFCHLSDISDGFYDTGAEGMIALLREMEFRSAFCPRVSVYDKPS
jgi:hypothetical protein